MRVVDLFSNGVLFVTIEWEMFVMCGEKSNFTLVGPADGCFFFFFCRYFNNHYFKPE